MRARVLWLFIMPLAACGGSDAECVIDTDCPLFNRCSAERCVPLGSDAAMDSGTPMDSSVDTMVADSGMDSGPTIVGNGSVSVGQVPLGPGSASHSMSASFTLAGAASICTVSEAAPCTITECVVAPPSDAGVPDAGMMDGGMPVAPNAGQIDLNGGMIDLSLIPGPDSLYPPVSGTGVVYAGGEALSVAAAGTADIPAFTQPLSAPFPVNVTAPSVAAGTITVDRTMDLTVTWTSVEASPGDVIVSLNGSEIPMAGGSRSVSVSCLYDGAAGSGTIPASTLSNLPGGGASGGFSVATRASSDLTSGEWAINVNASFTARGDTGGPATAAVTYP